MSNLQTTERRSLLGANHQRRAAAVTLVTVDQAPNSSVVDDIGVDREAEPNCQEAERAPLRKNFSNWIFALRL
jgi:hypothetical protein